jgi:transposase InsO family protein
VIDLPRSRFYYRSTATGASLSDARLVELIGDIQDELPGYGYRRVTRELQRRGHLVNHKRIARVMKSHGLGIRPRRRFVRTTDSDHDLPIFPNLYRNVIPARPDLVWVADFTYIRIATGFCFLAAILDACSRKVVGYAISRRIDTQLALAALHAAVRSRQPGRGCIHHTDRGCQGEFNRSSQHVLTGGVDENEEDVEFGSIAAREAALARATAGVASSRAMAVLEGDCAGVFERGRGRHRWRVAGGRQQMVPTMRRYASIESCILGARTYRPLRFVRRA